VEQLRSTTVGVGPSVSVPLITELLRLWPDLEGPERNAALKRVVARVEVRRGTSQAEPLADRIKVEIR
jgi:hypothetical protein